jgi:sigma-B regulation protein RsbU (phosphoserine phosphatase)
VTDPPSERTGPALDPPSNPGPSDETAEELFHGAPCGYLTLLPDGTISRVNQTFLDWTGYRQDALVGQKQFGDLLASGGRIFLETHMAPLLRLQGAVRELAFDLKTAQGDPLPVLVNATLVSNGGREVCVRVTVTDATVRRAYERELLGARQRAEASEEKMREVSLILQRSLLQGGLEHGHGFQVETRYRPAERALEVGGDWYDAFLLPDEQTLALSVGDVVGKGIGAATAMGQLRSGLRALAGTGSGPGAVLDQLDAFAARVPGAGSATVTYAEIDLSTGSLRYASAGHLPPLLVSARGDAEHLWRGRSLPLASFSVDGHRAEARALVEDGGRLVLYTDGLIERRDRDIDEGLAALATAAHKLAGEPLDAMADGLLTRLLADETACDDVCLLCASFSRRTSASAADDFRRRSDPS